VGRGSLPASIKTISELREQINKLQSMIADNKKPYDSKVTKEIDNNPPLEFFESLTLKKDEAKKKWQIENSPDTTKKEQKAVEVDAPAKSSIRGSNDIRVPEVANESSISGEQYTVQVASLKELDRAESLTRSLIGKGIDAYYLAANVNGKTYYRIRCGKFSDRNEAETYAQKIEADSGLKGFVSKVE
jgi:cell division septation protein DedD